MLRSVGDDRMLRSVGDDRSVSEFEVERGPDKFHRHFKQPFGQHQQFVRW
jgi:hypothetical protein